MAKQFRIQVFTQEKKVLDELVTSVVVPGADGSFGILADHAPLIAALGEGPMTIISSTGEKIVQISGGFLEVANNNAVVLADSLTF